MFDVKRALLGVPIFVLVAGVAFAQSPRQVNYCKALTASYRTAIGSGAAPMQTLEAATVECTTNPNGAIPTLERGLREMKVNLPARE